MPTPKQVRKSMKRILSCYNKLSSAIYNAPDELFSWPKGEYEAHHPIPALVTLSAKIKNSTKPALAQAMLTEIKEEVS